MIKHTCSFSDNYIDGSEFVKPSEAEVKGPSNWPSGKDSSFNSQSK